MPRLTRWKSTPSFLELRPLNNSLKQFYIEGGKYGKTKFRIERKTFEYHTELYNSVSICSKTKVVNADLCSYLYL